MLVFWVVAPCIDTSVPVEHAASIFSPENIKSHTRIECFRLHLQLFRNVSVFVLFEFIYHRYDPILVQLDSR
jgi:hypothetical protein